jgi:hypothetical protein
MCRDSGKGLSLMDQYAFYPRIINPVKFSRAIFFAAEEELRRSTEVLVESMPWTEVEIFHDPLSVSNYVSEKATVIILDDTALNVVDSDKIRENNKDAVLILLSSNDFISRSPPSISHQKYPYTTKADLVFAMDQEEFIPGQILPSVVRCAEDLLNIMKYSRVRRYIFLIVDDEPRWFSQFLPVLYNIIGQRADVMLARTFEEALKFLFGVEHESKIDEQQYLFMGHGDNVVCLIADIFFPKGNDLNSDAGKDLIRIIKRYYPRIPVIIASKAKEAFELREEAFILPKGDPGSLQTLHDYIQDFTGLGDFVLRDRKGIESFRAKDIYQLGQILAEAKKHTKKAQKIREILEVYGEKDAFSTWLYMHGFRELADELRPQHGKGPDLVKKLIEPIEREISRIHSTSLRIGEERVYSLDGLLKALHKVEPELIQNLSDNDVFSNWLDRKGYPELAEEIRPIHGSGEKLKEALVQSISKWLALYEKKRESI